MQHDLEVLGREAEQIVKDIGIPPCPAILTKLVHKMRDDDPDFIEIGRLISSDVGLAAAILKTVNSPFYGLRTKATSVQQALAFLGLANVAQLVTGLLLRQAFPVGTNAKMEQFWEFSSSVALINAYSARKFNVVDRDVAYTFALFRDCGIPLMIGKFRDYAPMRLDSQIGYGQHATDLETERYEMNHAVIGCHLAKSWMLPDETCQAILWHHDYPALKEGRADVSAASYKLIALALVSECLFTRHTMAVDCPEWGVAGMIALEKLGLSEADLDAAMREIHGELQAIEWHG